MNLQCSCVLLQCLRGTLTQMLFGMLCFQTPWQAPGNHVSIKEGMCTVTEAESEVLGDNS